MRGKLHRQPGIPAVLVLLFVASAAGGDTTWIKPDRFSANTGESIKLSMQRPAAGAKSLQSTPWSTVNRLFIRAGGGQENRADVPADVAGGETVAIALDHAGVTMIGADLAATDTTMKSDAFRTIINQALSEEARKGLPTPAESADVRVRTIACATTLIRVSDKDSEALTSQIAMSKTGQKAEIRPLFDPTSATVGCDLPLRAYVDGSKAEGVIVRATLPDGKTLQRTSDGTGSFVFPVDQSGVWHVQFACPRSGADDGTSWTYYSSTLTFEVPAKQGGGQ